MKSVFLAVAAATVLSANVYAGEANIYPSQISANYNEGAGYLEFSFFLNATPTRVDIVYYDNDGKEIHTESFDDCTAGDNTVFVDYYMAEATNFAVRATAEPKTTTEKFSDATKSEQCFNAAVGMAVMNNPNNPHFGTIYINEAIPGNGNGKRTTTEGIYLYNAALQDLGQGDTAYSGGIKWKENATHSSVSSPKDLALDANGNAYVCDWTDTHSGIWMMDINKPSEDFSNIFDAGGTYASNGIYTINGIQLHGSIPTLAVVGSGEDRVLYTSDEDLMYLMKYEIGKQSPWNSTPEKFFYDSLFLPNGTVDFAADKNGELWVSQRIATDDSRYNYSIFHLNKEGSVDCSYLPEKIELENYSIAINPDNTLLAVGRNKSIDVYPILSTDSGYELDFDNVCSFKDVKNNNYSLAFDYANNIYVGSSDAKYITAFAMPGDNVCEVPASAVVNDGITSSVATLLTDGTSVKWGGQSILISANGNNNDVAVYSISGYKVFAAKMGNSLTVNISDWNNGVYIIKVNNSTFKIIK